MKKQLINSKQLVTIFSLAITGVINSQSILQWANNTGDGNALSEVMYDICADKDINSTANQGNTISVGIFDGTIDADPGAGTLALTSVGYTDVLIRKLDPNGGLIWAKSIGGWDVETVLSVSCDNGGNVYFTGSFKGEIDADPGVGVFLIGADGQSASNAYLIKLDVDGNFVWATYFGDQLNDYGRSVATDANGNVYSAGTFQGTVDFDPGPGVSNLTGAGSSGYGMYLVKLDPQGNFLWAIEGGGNGGNNNIEEVIVDASNNVIMVGSFGGTADFDPGIGVENRTANSDDIFVWKLNSAGEYVYAHAIGGDWGDYAFDAATNNGNVYVTGHFRQTVDFDPGVGTTSLSAGSDYHCFILKLNSTGDFEWVQETSGWFTEGMGITTTSLEGTVKVHVTGRFEGTSIFDPNSAQVSLVSSPSDNDMFIATYNDNGSFVSANGIGGNASDIGRSIAAVYDFASADMAIYIAGSFAETVDFDPSANTYNLTSTSPNTSDMFVAKFGSTVNTAGINSSALLGISIYPNPASDVISVTRDAKIEEVNVFDAYGNLVNTFNTSTFSVGHLSAGIYFLTVSAENGITQSKFVKE